MKKIAFLLIILLSIPSQGSAEIGGEKSYFADDNNLYQFTLSAEAPVIWQRDVQATVYLNMTVDKLPDQNSGIQVVYLQYEFYAEINGEKSLVGGDISTISETYKTVNKTEQFEQSLTPPATVDSFTLNITVAAVTTGNDTSQDINNPRKYIYNFPEAMKVLDEPEQNLIDLYGFPPTNYLLRWVAIVIPLSLFMAIPSIYGFIEIQLKRRKMKKEEQEL